MPLRGAQRAGLVRPGPLGRDRVGRSQQRRARRGFEAGVPVVRDPGGGRGRARGPGARARAARRRLQGGGRRLPRGPVRAPGRQAHRVHALHRNRRRRRAPRVLGQQGRGAPRPGSSRLNHMQDTRHLFFKTRNKKSKKRERGCLAKVNRLTVAAWKDFAPTQTHAHTTYHKRVYGHFKKHPTGQKANTTRGAQGAKTRESTGFFCVVLFLKPPPPTPLLFCYLP
mmetsp:Transcript_16480/g.24732  ORF Transcript_16480/g.24732 Transcript_16480/m.24732 type:complete len:225 (+) Transcript_16480:486-1160(+)